MVSSGICGVLLCCAVYLGGAFFARGSDFLFCSRRVSWRSASSSSSFSCASALLVPRSSTLSLMARRACSASLRTFAGSCWRTAAREAAVTRFVEEPPSRTGLPAARLALVRAASALAQTQWRRRTRPSHPQRGVLPDHGLFAGDEKAQSRAAALGEDLQHRPPSSGHRLPNPTTVPASELIPTKGMKSVTHLLDEYTSRFCSRAVYTV